VRKDKSFSRPFPLNAWYAAARDVEVKNALFPRTIAGRKIVLYRKSDGKVAALEDACWHRLLPLSLGRIEGDQVVCGYHGLKFNESGRCTHMPSQDKLSAAARVPAFPVVEKHRFIWIWPGDPALADPNLVPDLHWNADPAWAGDGELFHLACDYRLVVDNLMDLTHETFVHHSSIGNDAVAETPFDTFHTEKTVQNARFMSNVDAPPFWAGQLGRNCKVDRWQIINFEAPCTVAIDVGVAPTGSGALEGDRSQGVNGYVINTIAPETDTTCHYFWAFVRNYRIDEQRLTHELREGVHKIFGEDHIVLEAQQRAIDAHPERHIINLNIDVGGMRARRIIDKMIKAEDAAQRQAAE
jgi:phenylpropionate dioxygenase-like ring-hydroxylating dioxygenase large terminal subunit